jgi:hypothetical protein
MAVAAAGVTVFPLFVLLIRLAGTCISPAVVCSYVIADEATSQPSTEASSWVNAAFNLTATPWVLPRRPAHRQHRNPLGAAPRRPRRRRGHGRAHVLVWRTPTPVAATPTNAAQRDGATGR